MIIRKILSNPAADLLTFDRTVIVREIYIMSSVINNVVMTFDSSGAYTPTPAWATNIIRCYVLATTVFRVANINVECKTINFSTSAANCEAIVFFDYKK